MTHRAQVTASVCHVSPAARDGPPIASGAACSPAVLGRSSSAGMGALPAHASHGRCSAGRAPARDGTAPLAPGLHRASPAMQSRAQPAGRYAHLRRLSSPSPRRGRTGTRIWTTWRPSLPPPSPSSPCPTAAGMSLVLSAAGSDSCATQRLLRSSLRHSPWLRRQPRPLRR